MARISRFGHCPLQCVDFVRPIFEKKKNISNGGFSLTSVRYFDLLRRAIGFRNVETIFIAIRRMFYGYWPYKRLASTGRQKRTETSHQIYPTHL